MTRVTSEGSSGTRYVNPRRSKGTSCLDGIENVHWVFLLTVYILTLAGPDFFLRALVSIGRGGLDLRDFGVYSFLLSSTLICYIKFGRQNLFATVTRICSPLVARIWSTESVRHMSRPDSVLLEDNLVATYGTQSVRLLTEYCHIWLQLGLI